MNLQFCIFHSGEKISTLLDIEGMCAPVLTGSYVLNINKVTAEVRETLQVGLTRALQHLSVYTEMLRNIFRVVPKCVSRGTFWKFKVL